MNSPDARHPISPGGTPAITGFHHVRLPSSDVLRSRDWYLDVLGFKAMLDFEEEDRISGIVLKHESGVVIGFHSEPDHVAAFRDFPILGLAVSDIDHWCSYLDQLGVKHSEITSGHLGLCVQLTDPDGLVIELLTEDQPSAYES